MWGQQADLGDENRYVFNTTTGEWVLSDEEGSLPSSTSPPRSLGSAIRSTMAKAKTVTGMVTNTVSRSVELLGTGSTEARDLINSLTRFVNSGGAANMTEEAKHVASLMMKCSVALLDILKSPALVDLIQSGVGCVGSGVDLLNTEHMSLIVRQTAELISKIAEAMKSEETQKLLSAFAQTAHKGIDFLRSPQVESLFATLLQLAEAFVAHTPADPDQPRTETTAEPGSNSDPNTTHRYKRRQPPASQWSRQRTPPTDVDVVESSLNRAASILLSLDSLANQGLLLPAEVKQLKRLARQQNMELQIVFSAYASDLQKQTVTNVSSGSNMLLIANLRELLEDLRR
eukprot:GILK01008123.1.p1 GENE.GILK01008123.1~~GILK01008123.1.p1  ORF type:complete len:344 (-),score=79.70 GILK01008123.1:165-1196(-)